MNTEYLYEFSVLARTLSFSRASQALFLSQPTLSRHVQRMEEELGVQLLVRSTHAVALTEAGRLLASQAERIVRRCSRAEQQMRKGVCATEGRLSVGCSTEIACASHIRMFLSAFLRQYPGIELRLEVLAKMPRDTLDHYDVVLSPCSYFDLPEGSRVVLVRRHETYLVLPAGHPLMDHATVGLHQLAGQTLIVPYADELFGPYAQNWQLAVRSCARKLNAMPVPNLTTALTLVSLGQGVLIAPRYVQSLAPPDIYLVAVSNPGCRFDEYLYAAHPADNPAAELFIDEFLHSIPTEPRK
ncbi:MAG: LysR family transcriptional regulator [Aristaeellaceae bacterium]